MLKQKMSRQGAPPAPQARTKKKKREIQTRKNYLIRIAKQVDVAQEEYLPEEEEMLQSEVEEVEGEVHQENPHKGKIEHRKQDMMDRGIINKQD